MPYFMYTLNYLFSFISLSISYTPINLGVIIDEASIALWAATNTPASSVDDKLRKQIWKSLWDRHYSSMKNNPKPAHLCFIKTANICKIIGASRKLGFNGTLTHGEKLATSYLVFGDGSKISLCNKRFWHADWRNKK